MIARLLGDLGAHARGKTLTVALGATPGNPPQHGVALAFGKEAQQSPGMLAEWVLWADEPGRVLILVPLFQRGMCSRPTSWEARRAEPLSGGESELGRVLACDRQYELRGELVPLERVGGQVVTGAWRRHPAAGLVVITTLPLWSLLVLDHRKALQDWILELVDQAGSPRTEVDQPGASSFSPGPDEWTMLLHLCTGPFGSSSIALSELHRSVVLRLDSSLAEAALERLTGAGWASAGTLTAAGERALAGSPFAHYARTLRKMRHA